MSDLLIDISTLLIDAGHATEDGVDVFRDFVPDDPDNIIVLNEYGNVAAKQDATTSNRAVQIMVRNIFASEAKRICGLVYRTLFSDGELIRDDLPNDRWAIISPIGSPLSIGFDDNNRSRYVFNLSIVTNID